jgi:hypothetical protein
MFRDGLAEPVMVWARTASGSARARLAASQHPAPPVRDRRLQDHRQERQPGALSDRTVWDNGWDVKASFYRRGLHALTGYGAEFRFAVQETYAPFALSVIAPSPSAEMLGDMKVQIAIDRWRARPEAERVARLSAPDRVLRSPWLARKAVGGSRGARCRLASARSSVRDRAPDRPRRRHRQRQDVQRAAAGARHRERPSDRRHRHRERPDGSLRRLFPESARRRSPAVPPDKYADAIEAAERFLIEQKVPVEHRVTVVDSASHEWYGEGGCLEWHDELMGGQQIEEPERVDRAEEVAQADGQSAAATAVARHPLLPRRAKGRSVKGENGRLEIVPKESLIGIDGWIPIAEKNLPFELTRRSC